MDLVYRVLGLIGTIITAYFAINFSEQSIFLNGFFVLVVCVSFVIVILDILKYLNNKQKVFSLPDDKEDIAKHLVDEIKKSTSLSIFSRDMTWVNPKSEAESVLIEKARDRALTLFLKSATDTSDKLRDEGAEVYIYGGASANFNPKSRFTILNPTRTGTRVMVGHSIDDKHLIKKWLCAISGWKYVFPKLFNQSVLCKIWLKCRGILSSLLESNVQKMHSASNPKIGISEFPIPR